MLDQNDEFATGAKAPPLPGFQVERVGPADWSRREYDLREWMDEPCTFATYREAAGDLARVNAITNGYGALKSFLKRAVAGQPVGYEPLHVVDVGCAQGDGLRTIHRWAAKRSLPLRLTGVDINPYAARMARECDRAEHVSAGTIAWVTADAFAVELASRPDVVISSLFAHHLSDAQIVEYLRWCEATAKVGWFVGDLRRSERAAKWFGRLAWAIGCCEMVKHDGAMSFRRALTVEEWRALCAEAGVVADVRDCGVGRLCVERMR